MGRRRTRRFSLEFKAGAVRLVQETDASLATIAQQLGVSKSTLLLGRGRATGAARAADGR